MKRYPSGSSILLESEPCSGLCVLLRGEVQLYKLSLEGKENTIAIIKPVIMFNEVAAIDGKPNPVSALALKNSIVWRTDYETFQLGLERFPELGIGLLPILARRNRKLIAKYADLSFRPVIERVAKMLLELSDYGMHPIQRESNSAQQMAAQIATVPVVISRSLGELRDKGYIETTRSEILVLQPQELARLGLLEFEPFGA
ncbi:MAG: Crp/Fnr family transcriptional regulator [Chloroflexota bacterium]